MELLVIKRNKIEERIKHINLWINDTRYNDEGWYQQYSKELDFLEELLFEGTDGSEIFEAAREFDSLDGVVDIHIVLPSSGETADLQALYPNYQDYLKTLEK